MNGFETRLARQLLGLNQTDFAMLLGWTSKKKCCEFRART
jgi:hypothetical protein